MPRIASVSLDRLHNLGNYEHLKFSVRVDLDADDTPGEVIHNLERLLGALAPVKKEYQYERALEVMSDPEKAKECTDETIALYKERIENHEKAIERRRSALQAFSDLGGISVHTDAKEKWEDQDDYDY